MWGQLQTFFFPLCSAFVILMTATSFADGEGGSMIQRTNSTLEKAQQALQGQQWDRSVDLLRRAATEDDQNAEIHNLLGYAWL